jgi:hypothetical protein
LAGYSESADPMNLDFQFDVFSQFTDLHARSLQVFREGVKLGGEEVGIGAALCWFGGQRVT